MRRAAHGICFRVPENEKRDSQDAPGLDEARWWCVDLSLALQGRMGVVARGMARGSDYNEDDDDGNALARPAVSCSTVGTSTSMTVSACAANMTQAQHGMVRAVPRKPSLAVTLACSLWP